MNPSTDTGWQTVGWNTIQLSCPARWDTIVSGTTHLLFEENFLPVFELRWQKKQEQSKQSRDSTLQTIATETGLLVQDSLPPPWKKLEDTYTLKLLADADTKENKAAILICKECGTILLLYFFDDLASEHHRDLSRVVSSINCHGQHDTETTLWAIQDFRILLPKSFRLSGHNFGAGLTRLSFNASGLTMHLCRLAGASQRLQSSSMLTLINLLGDLDIPEDEAQQLKSEVRHISTPSIFQQIRCRMKRKQPFHWVILRHHPEHDRLTGLFFFDKKPIPVPLTTSILNSYEIFSI